MSGTGTVHASPDPFLSDLDGLHKTAISASQRAADVVVLLNYALMRPEPVARIVFAVSAVESLGRDQTWSDNQKKLLKDLAALAEQSTTGTDAERQEVADAMPRRIPEERAGGMSARICRSAAVLVGCFAAGTVPYAQVPASVSSFRVSSAAVAAAGLPEAEHFAPALALERVPAGFVFAAGEPRVGAMTRVRSHDAAAPVQDALDRFLATHPKYSVARSDWAVVIHPRTQTLCHSALRILVTGAAIADPAYVAFWKLALLVNPADTPAVPPGLACGGGDCNSGVPPAHGVRVAVTLNGTTLQEALSQLVAQAPGLVWTLRERHRQREGPSAVPEAVCELGYFDGDRYLQTSYVFAKAPL